ncbi:MAG: cobalt ECF transporter T component CbiQ [Deltaproteobacteria bacterium]|mgnify:CR=1 FL=1|nr:MAG: cobalt ECF transporter T component CbiQ [Deltaproteobacteria bacterium]
MHLEEFAEGKSFWHRMDPRVKVLALTAFAVVTAISDHLPALLLALGLGVTSILTAKLDMKKVGVRLLVVNTFVLFLWLFLPFTTPGEVIWSFSFLTVKREGLELALAITLKTNAIVTASIGLIGTSSVFSLVHGMTHLKMPEKLVHLFFFCYRYISVIHEEYLLLRTSMRVRSFKAGTNMHTYKTFAYLLGMLFVRSYERSQRIYQAMVLRGFNGTFYTLDHFHMRGSDWCALFIMGFLTALVGALQWGVLN